MSDAKTLDANLNARADREFDRLREQLIGPMRKAHEHFGVYQINYRDSTGVERSFYNLAAKVSEKLEIYRETFREKFRNDFVAKVEAMQKEMESYIGQLPMNQEQPPQ